MESFRLRYPLAFEYKEPNKGSSKMKSLWEQRFKEFCDQTSLHGWAYLKMEEKWKVLTFLKRLLWALVIIGCAIGCGIFVIKRIIEYIDSDVVIMIESRSESLSEIYFPSVVICNINPLRKSFMYEVLQVKSRITFNTIFVLQLLWSFSPYRIPPFLTKLTQLICGMT